MNKLTFLFSCLPYSSLILPLLPFSFQLRRPDLNRRRTAYETVLEPDSSPLRSRPDILVWQ